MSRVATISMRSLFRDEKHGRLAGLVVLLLLTATVFSPVLYNGFTGWDDALYVTENPLVKALSWSAVPGIFSTFVSGNYHPLAVLLLAVEYRFFGPDPEPFHGISLLLHLVNTALVFRLLLLLMDCRYSGIGGAPPAREDRTGCAGALFGTLLFALHPMRVESVAWVSDQKDLLAAFFALFALSLYAGSGREKGVRRKAALILLFILALFSKATMVVLPPVLLLIDHLRGALDRRAWLEKIPFFFAAAVFGVTAIAARASYQPVLQESSLGLGPTLSMGLYRFLCYYLARTVAPFTTAFPLYPAPAATTDAVISGMTILVGAFVALCGLVALSLRWTRVVLFGSLFFFITLLPSLPVAVLGFSADRFSYLPSVALCFIAGAGFQKAWSPHPAGPWRAPTLLPVAAGFICFALAMATFHQSRVWRTSVSLWSSALELYPATPGHEFNRAQAYHNRGLAWHKEGALDRALADLDSAVSLVPDWAAFLTARGMVHSARGEPAAAFNDFTRAIETGSGGGSPLVERGILHSQTGALAAAAADFKRALEIDPANAAARNNLGIVFLDSGEYVAAEEEFTRLLDQVPGSAAAFYGRAAAASALGEHRRALENLVRAEALGYPVEKAFRERVRRQAESQR